MSLIISETYMRQPPHLTAFEVSATPDAFHPDGYMNSTSQLSGTSTATCYVPPSKLGNLRTLLKARGFGSSC